MFGRRFKLFELSGFPIYVDLSWFLIAVLITWSLAEGLFNQTPMFAGLEDRPWVRWGMGIAGALGLFVSIILHELGHAKVAERYGLPMRGITLFIFGGVAEMSEEPSSAKVEFLMAIGGPIVSIGIAITCGLLTVAAGAADAPIWLRGVLGYLAFINLLLVVFNLIPAFPLDGGRVLRSIIWHVSGDLEKSTRISSTIGAGFGVALMAFAAVRLIFGDLIGALWWFLIGMFLRNAAQMSYQRLRLREMLQGETVRRFMQSRVVTVGPEVSLLRVVEDHLYKDHYKLYPVTSDGRLVGCLPLERIKQVPRDAWGATTVGQAMEDCGHANTIGIEADAMDALERMNLQQRSRLMVVDGERLAGVITLRDLLGFFSMKVELGRTAGHSLQDANERRSLSGVESFGFHKSAPDSG